MNNLTTGNKMTMTSLELLDVINGYREDDDKKGLRHDTFMKKIEDELEEAAPKFIGTGTYLNGTGSEVQRPIYILPKEECMLMAMRESKYVRRQTVEYIKSLEKPNNMLPDFTNPVEMAKEWITQYEERLVLESKVKEDAPKVEFHDKVSNVTTNSTLNDVAKVLGLGRNKMMKWMRDSGILDKNNKAYQRFIESKHFVVSEKVGNNYLSYTTYVTGKGQTYLFNRLRKEGILANV